MTFLTSYHSKRHTIAVCLAERRCVFVMCVRVLACIYVYILILSLNVKGGCQATVSGLFSKKAFPLQQSLLVLLQTPNPYLRSPHTPWGPFNLHARIQNCRSNTAPVAHPTIIDP